MAAKLRVHLDDTTVDIITKNPAKYAEHVAKTGVWVNANKLYPPSRIAHIEIIQDDEKDHSS